MKRTLLIILALLLLCGCADKDDVPVLGSQEWTTPPLTWGVLESEKLEVLPWNCGRCEATSFYFMAETKLGYYMNIGYKQLYYADKADLSNWVPVCNKPNCGHMSTDTWRQGQPICNSEQRNTLFIRDGRIWYEWMPYGGEFDGREDVTLAQMSMMPDGTDRREEVMGPYFPTIRTYSLYTCPQYTYYNVIEITEDGSWLGHGYRLLNGKLEEYVTVPVEEDAYEKARLKNAVTIPVYGDALLHNGLQVPTETSYLRYLEEGYEILELSELPAEYSYLSGDVLRFFRTNDGYYDINIRNGEEVKLADCRLENSYAAVALPNCILESTLLTYYSLESRTPGQTHAMMLFDGEQWREVELPSELQFTDTGFLRFKCVASDAIYFRLQDTAVSGHIEKTDLYRIDLTQEKLTLEFCVFLDGMVPCK